MSIKKINQKNQKKKTKNEHTRRGGALFTT